MSATNSGIAADRRVLWEPSAADLESSNVRRFMTWLARERGLTFDGYDDLWRWSVGELAAFWDAIWDFYEIAAAQPPDAVLTGDAMPEARFFPGARLNYAEHVLARAPAEGPAIVAVDERGHRREITTSELRGQVGALAAQLRRLGVGPGDRVVACVPNIPAAVVAMLATTSLGAVWAACGPDLGLQSLVDRFAQLQPKVLVAVEEYRFAGVDYDRRAVVADLQAALPTLAATVLVGPQLDALVARPEEPAFAAVDFDDPLWVLFSSGTTGIPKGIVHGHGGILVEHLKSLGLCLDLRPSDTFFFHTSTSWMAWNYLVGGLLHGTRVVLYDGSPAYPSPDALWQVAARTGASVLGMGSAYVSACHKSAVELSRFDLGALRIAIPTGSPLPPAGWDWLARELPARTRIDSLCGGTDVCSVFFGGSPLLPVRRLEISARWLGVHAAAYDASGRAVVDQVGDFVVVAPMPSMPLRLWGDDTGARLRDAYFDAYPGAWRQGDWITIREDGAVQVWGRSDATLNKAGVRMGSAELYGVVEQLDDVFDSLVVGVELPDGGYYMPLFVVAGYGDGVDEVLAERIRAAIRTQLSPRHVPTEIVAAPAIPRTLTGKKLELPIKRLLQGEPLESAVAAGAVDRPDALAWFERFAQERRA